MKKAARLHAAPTELSSNLLARLYNRSRLTALVPQFRQRIRFDDTGQQAQIPDLGAPFSAPANL